MIFTVLLLHSCLFLKSLVSCASVEYGSQHISPTSLFNDNHVALSNSNHSSINSNSSSSKNASIISSNVGKINPNPLATTNNGPLEDQRRRLRTRQVSPSEWLFSTLVQPPPSSAAREGQQQSSSASQNRRGNPPAYRSIAPSVSSSNYYTNYYRNPNIYSQQTGRRIDGGEDKHIHEEDKHYDQEGSSHHVNAEEVSDGGLGRRRSSSLPFGPNQFHVSGDSTSSATSKMPEVISSPHYSGTTGLSKTAPATDPTLLGSEERATSTQEMQISDADAELGSRAEIGRGRKRGREMGNGATASLYFKESDSAPIIFPGSSTTSASSSTGKESSVRTYTRPSTRNGGGTSKNTFGPGTGTPGPWPAITLNPSDKRHIDGWNKLHELRQKSKSMQDGKKSSIASDASADAKIISILNIENTPRCAQSNGYCEEIDGYPKSFFNQVLNRTLNLSPDVFQDIFGETTDNNSVFTDVEYSLRDGFDETPLCSVREHTIYPKAAQNRRGKFMYIVNHDEYLQGIRVETCSREKDSCMFTEGHLPGYSSTCRQKYIYKKLLAFSPDGKAMPDTFRLPSCCVCYVKSMFISDRINPVVDLGGANADIQPTVSADDGSSWSPGSSSTISYPSHQNGHPQYDDNGSFVSSTEPMGDIGSITFPSTSSDDLASYQVPSPTTSTSRSTLDGGGVGSSDVGESHQNGGQQQNRAENQTASRRLHM